MSEGLNLTRPTKSERHPHRLPVGWALLRASLVGNEHRLNVLGCPNEFTTRSCRKVVIFSTGEAGWTRALLPGKWSRL